MPLDPKDDAIVATAVKAKADYLVTGDRKAPPRDRDVRKHPHRHAAAVSRAPHKRLKGSERVRAGMSRARAEGKRISRPPIPEVKRRRIEELHRAGTSINGICKETGIGYGTGRNLSGHSSRASREESRHADPQGAPLLLPDRLGAAFGLVRFVRAKGCWSLRPPAWQDRASSRRRPLVRRGARDLAGRPGQEVNWPAYDEYRVQADPSCARHRAPRP